MQLQKQGVINQLYQQNIANAQDDLSNWQGILYNFWTFWEQSKQIQGIAASPSPHYASLQMTRHRRPLPPPLNLQSQRGNAQIVVYRCRLMAAGGNSASIPCAQPLRQMFARTHAQTVCSIAAAKSVWTSPARPTTAAPVSTPVGPMKCASRATAKSKDSTSR